MPKIPVYEQQFDRQSVNLGAPMQNISAPVEAFGGGDAKAVASLGKGTADIGTAMMVAAKRMKEEEDDAKSLAAYTQYHDALNVYLQGDGSEGSGVYNRLGGSAIGATKEARETLDRQLQDISASLDNDQQRTLFNKRAQAIRMESLTSVSRHEAQQRRAYQAETYKSMVGKESDYAVLNFTNPEQVDAALGRMSEAAKASARLQGLSPESTEQMVNGLQSSTLKSVAMRHIENGNFSIAKEIMQDKRLQGDDVAAVEKSLKAGSDRAKSYDLFQQAMGTDDPLAWLSTKKDIDPAIRDATEQRVKSEIQWRRSEKNEAERVAARDAEDSLVKALDKGDLNTANRIVEDSPAGMRKEFRAYMQARLEGKDIVDDPVEKWKWTQMLADEPEKFKAEWNSPAMMAKLSPSTRQQFDSAYIALGKKGAKPILDEVASDTSIIKTAATVLGIKVDDVNKNAEVAQRFSALEREYTRLVEQEMAIKGRKLSTSEKQQLVDDNILLKGKVKGSLWGTNEAYKFNAAYDKKKDFRISAELDPVRAVRFEARQQGVPEGLAHAVMMAESGGSQDAASPKGALGLMQLMPDTARGLGVNPKDPDQNVQGGVRYLKQMLDKYKDKRLALLAYNWGPGNVDSWMRSGGAPDKVPAESVSYVRKVLANER